MGNSGDRALPPIHRVKLPQCNNRSTVIRWLRAMGYEVSEIAKHLNIRYQQVRNVLVTVPKRAAREDMPPLELELYDLADDVQSIMDHELERSLDSARRERDRKRQSSDEDDEEAA